MTKFNGDSAKDFMEKANGKYGDGNLGETNAKPQSKYSFKDGKALKLVFTCPITMDFAEVGSGKADKANKAAIIKIAGMAKSHEGKHKSGYEAAFKKWNGAKVAKDIMGKTFKSQKEADDAIADAVKDLEDALMKACLALHQKEGLLEATDKPDGSVDVTMKPAGADGCS